MQILHMTIQKPDIQQKIKKPKPKTSRMNNKYSMQLFAYF